MNHLPTTRNASHFVQTQLRRLGLLLVNVVAFASITSAKPLTGIPLLMPTATPSPDTKSIQIDKSSISEPIFPYKTFRVSGTAKNNTKVQIKNDLDKSVIGEGYADADGKWGIDIKLPRDGTYTLQAEDMINDTTDMVTILVLASASITPTPTN